MKIQPDKSSLNDYREYSFWEFIKHRCGEFFRPSDAVRNDIAEVDEDALPLCANCLEPQDPAAHFCPKCGAPVGQYTNSMPYEYILSMGWSLRHCDMNLFKKKNDNETEKNN